MYTRSWQTNLTGGTQSFMYGATTSPDACFAKGETSVTSNPEWDDEDRYFVYGNHNPSGASVRSLLFFA